MKTLHFDCFAGISGDMTLGALVDLGVDPDALRRELGKLGLPGWQLDFRRDERSGIHGVHAVVLLDGQTDHVAHDEHEHAHHHEHAHDDHGSEHDHEHSHDHNSDQHGEHKHTHHDYSGDHYHEHDHNSDQHHEHDHAHHEHSHDHNGDHHHEHDHAHHDHAHHAHTTWKEIRALIESSGISAGAKKRALDIFQRIAEAEAQVHGSSADEVGFHEVGALDSIIDIVGAAVCLDMLQPERITCGAVELGGGMVRCAHGTLPVPAPATAILVRGMPVTSGGFNKEMTTPTGAAILAASVDEFITTERYREIKNGYGIGTRKMEKPNLLRVSWRETDASSGGGDTYDKRPWQTQELFLLEAAIDDMPGEALGFFMEALFAAGALDVTMVPCVMKKSRPGTIVSALAAAEKLDALRRTFFERSTTTGFREIPVLRHSLRRETETLRGAFGEARRKLVFMEDGQALRGKIEYEDRARLARERGLSLEAAERLIMDGAESVAETSGSEGAQ